MDRSLFTARAAGELVEIGGQDVAFVPAPLPPHWSMAEELWPQLVRARAELALLEGLTRNLTDPALLLRPLQQREALRSSSLEGTYATPQELLLFDLEEEEPTELHSQAAAWQEVHNYARALDLGTQSVSDGVSLVLVRQLHEALLRGVRGRDKSPGKFRTSQVYVGSDHRFIPPPPSHLTACLDGLRDYVASPNDALDPLIRCFVVHYQLEAIHPFLDGNGRVGRLLLALMIKEWCGLSRPWLYMSAFFDRNKSDYIDRLFGVSTRADWTSWVDFCLRATIEQAQDTVARGQKLLDLRSAYQPLVQQSGANARLLAVVDRLFSNPFIRITDVRDRLDVSYPTAQKDVERLVDLGILTELPELWPKTFCARQILDVAFTEPE